jgi:hypothetical protein
MRPEIPAHCYCLGGGTARRWWRRLAVSKADTDSTYRGCHEAVGSTVKRSVSSAPRRRPPSLAQYSTTRRILARTSALLPTASIGDGRRRSPALQSPDSELPSRRGYHPTRRSSRRTDARQKSDGDAPRPSTTATLARCRIRHPLRGRPAVHPDGCSSSRFRSSSMPSRMKDEVFLYFV